MAAIATADDIALLLGRAAFGATKNDLTIFTGQDYAQVVDLLFPPAQPISTVTIPGQIEGNAVPKEVVGTTVTAPSIPPQPDDQRRIALEDPANNDIQAAQRWWLNRMATGLFPLREKMTLFWHSHMPNEWQQVPNSGHLMVQNETMRRNALGDLRQMLYELTIDVSMLYYLSGYVNRRTGINENYARELFELFTMGTIPQTYTETDIRQAAKALSGWVVTNNKGVYNDGNHDRTAKTIFGVTLPARNANDPLSREEYKRVVDLALLQPTTARFIAYKMVCAFAYVPATTNLVTNPDPLVDAVANALRPADPAGVWDITKALKVLLNHNLFRNSNAAAGQALVRTPVEVAVHLGKVLQIELDPPGANTDTFNGNHNQPIFALRRMGQVPFQPPNVAGWPKGTAWFSTIQTRGRYDLVRYLLNRYTFENRQNTNPMPASTDIAGWTSFLGLGHLSALTHNRLNTYLANPGTADERTKQDSILFLLVSSPDWQVM